MLNQIAQIKAQTPFVMNDLIYIHVDRRIVRRKEQDEAKLLANLRMALLLSVFKSDGDHPLDDMRVNRRLDEMLNHIRKHTASMKFYRAYVYEAGEIAPGVFLKVNHSITEAIIYRRKENNITFLRA
jgi:hypothetical protein